MEAVRGDGCEHPVVVEEVAEGLEAAASSARDDADVEEKEDDEAVVPPGIINAC